MSDFKTSWAAEKLKQRAEREQRQFARAMASPVTRAEQAQAQEMQLNHIASLALAMETLEAILIERGMLSKDELMGRMEELAKLKLEQVEAQYATQGQSSQVMANGGIDGR